MSQTLPQLEQRRQQQYRELEQVGDFRPGMISVRYRKCGKANCACAHKQHPGHGPQYLWNTTQGGKSRAENLHLGPELEKARQEVENYQRFTALCRQLVEVNEQICQLRPVPEVADTEVLESLKKKLQRIYSGRSSRK